MTENAVTKQKCIDIVEDRVVGVENDLKAFIYIRKHSLQHKEDNIGGGNIVVALSLFTTLSFLGKVYYCVIQPGKFKLDGKAKNETETFVQFMKFIQTSGIDLGLTNNGEVLELVWHGFRDYLAHRLTVEPGKSVITFYFEPEHKGTITEILANAKAHKAFEHDGSNKNWTVNGDTLLAYLPVITGKVTEFVKNREGLNPDLLKRVVGIK